MAEAAVPILLIDDDEDDWVLTRDLLREIPGGRFELEWASSYSAGLEACLRGRHELVLVDYHLGAWSGLDLIREAQSKGCHAPFVVMTGTGDRAVDLKAQASGATDYLVKGRTDAALLERSIRYALERARAVRALEARTAELARSNADLEQFAYVVSHDLRSPLQSMTVYLDLLEGRAAERGDTESAELARGGLQASERMAALIDDLLAYARLGVRPSRPDPVDASAVLAGVLDELRPALLAAGATVEHGALPVVRGHATQFAQVFRNLLTNALKFHGLAAPRIEVGCAEVDGEWRFRIADNGIGIPSEHRERVFGMFQRLVSTESLPGTGIGLAICKKVVELHGGRMWVESEPGAGSTFYFTLPMEGAAEVGGARRAGAARPTGGAAGSTGGGARPTGGMTKPTGG